MKKLFAKIGASQDFLPASLVALAGLADSGKYPGNAHRDLLAYLGERAMPKAFKAMVHAKSH